MDIKLDLYCMSIENIVFRCLSALINRLMIFGSVLNNRPETIYTKKQYKQLLLVILLLGYSKPTKKELVGLL